MLTSKVPFFDRDGREASEAAAVEKERPRLFPSWERHGLSALLASCWGDAPATRPTMNEALQSLKAYHLAAFAITVEQSIAKNATDVTKGSSTSTACVIS